MAQLKEKVIGKVSGSLGDFVGRIRKGNNYLSMKPSSYKINNDPASIERRGKFRMACKLSKAVTSSQDIKALWQKSNNTITPYNNVLKVNYPFVSSGDTTSNVILTPGLGFPVQVDTLNVSDTQISVALNPLNNADAFDLGIETKVKMFAVLFLNNTTNTLAEPYIFLPFSSDEKILVTDTGLNFNIDLTGAETNYFNNYSNNKLHYVIFTLDDNNNVIHFSNTNSSA